MNRYVVGVNDEGNSDVLVEQDLTELPQLAPGLFGRDLWLTFETPADVSGSDDPTDQPLRHEPPDGGSIFRVMKLLPQESRTLSAEEVDAMHEKISSVHVPSPEELARAKDPSMHKTDTLNYFVMAAGEIVMLTEERDVVLRPGDVVVQKACMHGWRNEGSEPAVLVGVMIDAQPVA